MKQFEQREYLLVKIYNSLAGYLHTYPESRWDDYQCNFLLKQGETEISGMGAFRRIGPYPLFHALGMVIYGIDEESLVAMANEDPTGAFDVGVSYGEGFTVAYSIKVPIPSGP
jgi:hypothetical protein